MRPNRYALARSLGVPLQPDELALHECDIPLWAPGAAHPRHPAHVLALTAANDVLARRVRRADRRVIPSDGLRAESLVVRVDLVSTMLRAGRPPSVTAVSVAPSFSRSVRSRHGWVIVLRSSVATAFIPSVEGWNEAATR